MSNPFFGCIGQRFQSNTLLFRQGDRDITVSMLLEAINYMLAELGKRNPTLEQYRVTMNVLRAIQMRLANRQSRRPSKKDLKTACDVLSEIQKENAITEEQRNHIDIVASWCKLCIERYVSD